MPLILREQVKREVECEGCEGSGTMWYGKCPACHGTGKRRVTFEVEAEIEPFVWYDLRQWSFVHYRTKDRNYSGITTNALAGYLLTAHLTGEELPWVTVREIGEGKTDDKAAEQS